MPAKGCRVSDRRSLNARRYNLCGLLNVTADEDDDGNGNGRRPAPPSQPAAARAPTPAAATEEELVDRARNLLDTCKTGPGLLGAIEKIGNGRDRFPNVASYTAALVAAYAHQDVCTAHEFEDVKRRVTWFVNHHPDNLKKETA